MRGAAMFVASLRRIVGRRTIGWFLTSGGRGHRWKQPRRLWWSTALQERKKPEYRIRGQTGVRPCSDPVLTPPSKKREYRVESRHATSGLWLRAWGTQSRTTDSGRPQNREANAY